MTTRISLHLEADNVGDLHSQMLALLAGTAIAAATTKPAGRGKAKTDETQPPTAPQEDAGNADTTGQQGSGAGVTGSEGQSSAAGEVTKDSLSAQVLQYGSKAGPQAVGELFKEFGATKFSEIPVDKYGAMNVRLVELLAA